MGEFFYNALSRIYGSSLSESVADKIETLLTALDAAFSDASVDIILNIFTGVAVSFLIIYFVVDLASQVQKDMLTFEKLIISVIKLFIACAILIYLDDILHYMVLLAHAIYDAIDNADLSAIGMGSGEQIKYFPSVNDDPTTWPEKYSDVKSVFEDAFGSKIKSIFTNLGSIMAAGISYLLTWVATIAAYVVCISNAVMLIVRAIFSPIAVVQCFEDGQRSAGIRYLKKLFATALTFAIIAAVLAAMQMFNDAMLASSLEAFEYIIDYSEETKSLKEIVNGGAMMLGCAVQVAGVGAILGGTRIADEVVGVH